MIKNKTHLYRHCPCGESVFNQKHVLFDCEITQKYRKVLEVYGTTEAAVTKLSTLVTTPGVTNAQ
jgi:hypothetical protein